MTYVNTSDNIIVQAMRCEGRDIEIRFAECLGIAGEATIRVDLPHEAAFVTNMRGENPEKLDGEVYTSQVNPQQIVTLRLRTDARGVAVKPLTDGEPLVPTHKHSALKKCLPGVKGHPPNG